MKRYVVLLILIIVLFGCKKPDANRVIASDVLKYIEQYDALPRTEIAIYCKNSEEPKSVLLFVHGGAWSRGSYSDYLTPQIINWAMNLDFQLCAINYSLSPYHIELANPNRIKHPAHIRDLAKSVKWIVDNAMKYNFDTAKIFLIGHSAGALMVCLLATNQKYIEETGLPINSLAGVVSLDGGAYLTNEEWLMFPSDNDTIVEKQYIELKNYYYNAFTTDPQYYSDACPYNFIEANKGIPPFLFVSQQESITYRSRPNRMMYRKMVENGIDATLYLAPTSDHMQTLWSIGTSVDNTGVANAVSQFLLSH